LILKLKTKDFKDYKYSIFLKLKNKQSLPFKEYTKKNLDKDIKIIIKCIFWSDYIDKNNIYAIYYLKKHLSTKKQTSINLINLLYRLLTNAPTKITSGGMFENTRKKLGETVKAVTNKIYNSKHAPMPSESTPKPKPEPIYEPKNLIINDDRYNELIKKQKILKSSLHTTQYVNQGAIEDLIKGRFDNDYIIKEKLRRDEEENIIINELREVEN
jgi:hypothetical protein